MSEINHGARSGNPDNMNIDIANHTLMIKQRFPESPATTTSEGDEPKKSPDDLLNMFNALEDKRPSTIFLTPPRRETSQKKPSSVSKKLSQQRNPNRRGIWNSKRQIDVVTF